MVWEQPSKAALADRLWGRHLEDSGAGVRYSCFQVSGKPVPLWRGGPLAGAASRPQGLVILSAHRIVLYLLKQVPWYHHAHT